MICKVCGKEFTANQPWHKYCGPECSKAKRRENKKLWTRRNPEANRLRMKEWVEENPEQHKRNCKKYADSHREQCNKAVSDWTKTNPDKARAKTQRHRARKAGNGGSYSPQEWEDLKAMYGNKCLCCGRTEGVLKALHLHLVPDHVISVKLSATVMLPLGFLGSIQNIQPLCHAIIKGSRGGCNQSKCEKYIDYR